MAADGMIFYYGDYQHPKGEVYPAALEIKPLRTEDGIQWAYDATMKVRGNFVQDATAELDAAGVNTRIAELEQVYRFDYKDAGFLLPNGNTTEHYLLTDDAANLSGNRVTSRSWDHVYPTEFANTRSFSVTIEARILSTYSDIIYFSETTLRKGTGGPQWELTNTWGADPEKEFITDKSKVIHVQSGVIIGLRTWPTPPDPYWPDEEQTWRRIIRQTSPRLHGHPSYVKATHYRLEYSYFFERIGYDTLFVPPPFYIP